MRPPQDTTPTSPAEDHNSPSNLSVDGQTTVAASRKKQKAEWAHTTYIRWRDSTPPEVRKQRRRESYLRNRDNELASNKAYAKRKRAERRAAALQATDGVVATAARPRRDPAVAALADKQRSAEYRRRNREKIKAAQLAYRQANPDRRKNYYAEHKEQEKASHQAWSAANPGGSTKRAAKCKAKNPARVRERKASPAYRQVENARLRFRRSDDPLFKMVGRLRSRLQCAVKRVGTTKCTKSVELIGCTPAELRDYLESKFLPGMTWDNAKREKGRRWWEIDHIVPVAAFDLIDPDQQRRCFSFKNLQPLWAEANRIKNSNIVDSSYAEGILGEIRWRQIRRDAKLCRQLGIMHLWQEAEGT